MTDKKQALEVAGHAGRILLESGAEIGRVQDTMLRILEHYEVPDHNVYVISNGIFATAAEREPDALSLVRHVPLGSVNLSRIDAVNHISRRITSGLLSPDEAEEELAVAETLMPEKPLIHVLACGLGAAAFCCLFGGTVPEGLAAFPIGVVLWLYLLATEGKQSRFIQYILGGVLVTVLSAAAGLIPGIGFTSVVIGGIIPLVPGVTFSNSVREFFNGDYLSGIIHLIAAVLTAVCIALGVCGGVALVSLLGGGAL